MLKQLDSEPNPHLITLIMNSIELDCHIFVV